MKSPFVSRDPRLKKPPTEFELANELDPIGRAIQIWNPWTIYSATTFLERCRKVVREIWFENSGSRKVVDQKKRWFYTINSHFFLFEKSG